MKPAPPETAELLHRVRQQLILAQVRIMELEDVQAELATRLALLDRSLAGLQAIATDRIAERDHLIRLKAGLDQQAGQLQQQLAETRTTLREEQARAAGLETALQHTEGMVAGRSARLAAVEAELRAVHASRSWRWTAPLRALVRRFGRTPRE